MALCILDILSLLHPYAPHITEMLYSQITQGKVLALSEWPESKLGETFKEDDSMSQIWDIIRVIRNLRAESGVKPAEKRDVILIVPTIYRQNIEANLSLMTGLARIENITLEDRSIKGLGYAYGVTHGIEVYVDASLDTEKIQEERARLAKEIENKKNYIRAMQAKLKNTAFISNAPEKVVRTEMEKVHLAEVELEKLETKYKHIE